MTHPARQKPAQRATAADRVRDTIARLEGKRDTAPDALSAWYYRQCLAGWRAHLAKLEQEPCEP